jgi:DNA-binding PadR family transcriptional regulator
MLEEQGMASCSLSASEAGPAKRVYQLTGRGRTCLSRWIDTLDRYRQAIAELVVTMREAEERSASRSGKQGKELSGL